MDHDYYNTKNKFVKRGVAVMTPLPRPYAALGKFKQIIIHKNKMPADYRNGKVCDAHNPEVWTDYQTAKQAAEKFGSEYGVGFVLTKDDPFFVVDIDKCSNPAGGWSDTARTVMSYFPDALVEASQSGKGLHIFSTSTNMPDHACKNIPLDLEFYDIERFIAFGNMETAIGDAGASGEQYLQAFVNTYMPPRIVETPETWTTQPVEGCHPLDDEALIKKALGSKSAAGAFGVRATFRNLWERDVEALSAVYTPDASDKGDFDESSADMALAQHLAFWTGKNCEAIERLLWLSGLVRDKWAKHKNYLPGTIMRAVSLQNDSNVYKGKPPKVSLEKAVEPLQTNTESEVITGYQFLGATQQQEYFKGCVYVQDIHRIFTPRGSFLNQYQFNATFGGYVFAMDDANRKETKKAWEAFTESQLVRFPKVETTCFKPKLQPGEIVNIEGTTAVNTYVPTNTPRVQGDPAPFLNQLCKLLPDERDRAIILAYMASCIQHKGVKFQWAPLIQGTEGNGKTLLTRCVAFAIGKKYTHWPNAADLDNKFNAWLINVLFIAVEDIYVPSHKGEVIEAIKPMITGGDGLEIQRKGVDQTSADICCNFMFNSNHRDAIETKQGQRRFAVFHTAQQSIDDIKRDGMDGDYFPDLYHWLKHENGYAIVANYLETYQIPDALNPATSCHRAPVTSSTEAAIQSSMGDAEILIIDAIDNDLPGFRGGIVWTRLAIELLRDNGKNIHTRALSRVLENIEYIKHPAADSSGRIKLNGKRERFYVKRGHPLSLIKTTNDLRHALHELCGDVARGSRGQVGAAASFYSAPPRTQ